MEPVYLGFCLYFDLILFQVSVWKFGVKSEGSSSGEKLLYEIKMKGNRKLEKTTFICFYIFFNDSW